MSGVYEFAGGPSDNGIYCAECGEDAHGSDPCTFCCEKCLARFEADDLKTVDGDRFCEPCVESFAGGDA